MGSTSKNDSGEKYWQRVLGLLSAILLIWFIVSFGFGILFASSLNGIKLGGYPMGFWFANQGSIYIFILLIFLYAWQMGKLDEEFNVHED